MELSGINAALSAVQANPSTDSLSGAASMKMLENSIDASQQMSASMIKMMENSVTPELGSNFDVSV